MKLLGERARGEFELCEFWLCDSKRVKRGVNLKEVRFRRVRVIRALVVWEKIGVNPREIDLSWDELGVRVVWIRVR